MAERGLLTKSLATCAITMRQVTHCVRRPERQLPQRLCLILDEEKSLRNKSFHLSYTAS